MQYNIARESRISNKIFFIFLHANGEDVGSAMGALPPFGGRFPIACPRTVRASLPAYGSPLVMSVYLS